MKNVVSNEQKKQMESIASLTYRRLNWKHVAQPIIKSEFQKFVSQCESMDFPIKFFIKEYPQQNESQLQISASRRPTGVLKPIPNALGLEDFDNVMPQMEGGCALVASQSVWGTISFIAYPFSSDRVASNQKELFLYHNLDPNDITPRLIHKVLEKYLLLTRQASVWNFHDSFTLYDHWIYFLMKIKDVRMKVKVARSVLKMDNEWLKIIVPIIFAAIGGYISGKQLG